MKYNPILATDSYKFSHAAQYPPGTTKVRSYFESRGGAYQDVVAYGALHYILRQMLGTPVTMEDIDEAESVLPLHFGPSFKFNRRAWELLVNRHRGYLPLRIRAVPEGTVLPVRNALLTVENTDDDFYWLTNYVETRLTHVWYPYTVATLSAPSTSAKPGGARRTRRGSRHGLTRGANNELSGPRTSADARRHV